MKGSDVVVTGVSKFFENFRALNNVSLEIKKGEFFSLLGPSGCGKTTLLRILAGFEQPGSGSVTFDGKDVLHLPPDRRHANTVFQNYALFPHLSVFENVAFSMRLKKSTRSEIERKVGEYLRLVQLEGHAHKKPNQLSGGQKQRVAIARALINEPSVLLLDEPLSALDAKLRQHMLIELDQIHDKIGITFIYVTHDQQEALSVSDRLAVMNQGDVLQIGTPHDIYESPATDFVARFIGETNLFDANVVRVETLNRDSEEHMAELDIPERGRFRLTTGDEIKPGPTDSFTI
ncbi:MAG: spermidine/putrescine ABC transporter ATP-binding protein, partial [Treponema sp.]|nr:spermidine/putrescine ABC transporter ATP-binding protein [Treponema sp.]